MIANALATLLAASALLTSAAPVSEALEARSTGVLKCTPSYTGYLQAELTSSYTNISFTGPKLDGLPLLHTTGSSGDEVTRHEFTFMTCVSNKIDSYMGAAPLGSIGPGHIELASVPGKCITRKAIEGEVHSKFVLDDCSFADDASQLLQSFALGTKGYVEFLGYRHSQAQDWKLSVSAKEYGEILAEHVVTGNIVGNIEFYYPDYYTPTSTES